MINLFATSLLTPGVQNVIRYRFGFLNRKLTHRFDGGEIALVSEFDQNENWIERYAHTDGFLYPPTTRSRNSKGNRSSNSDRPAHLHRLPASHELRLTTNSPSSDNHRSHASFIMQLVAYLHGTWLQFADWWFDSRVPLNGTHNIHFATKTAEHFLSHAYTKWQGWPDKARTRFTNVLFMLNRAPSYEWDWEHFLIEYMVFDACVKTTKDLGLLSPSGKGALKQASQFDLLCSTFGLRQKDNLRDDMVRLRNDLFHEALWDGGQPGAAKTPSSYFSPLHLRRFNQRLILAILAYNNDYVKSAWWSMSQSSFQKP
jgi:hypothetical protein